MKKVITLVLCLALAFSLATVCHADEMEETTVDANYHVSTVAPWDRVSPQGTSSPKDAWNIHNSTYHFKGSSSGARLYLNYLLYGCTYYGIVVNNKSASNRLTVNPHDALPVAPFTVSPGSTWRSADNYVFRQRSGAPYVCFSFDGPSYFDGYVYDYIYQ